MFKLGGIKYIQYDYFMEYVQHKIYENYLFKF